MRDRWDAQLKQVLNAYYRGLARPPHQVGLPSGEIFAQCLKDATESRFPAAARDQMIRCIAPRTTALLLARRGQLDQAAHQMDEAHRLFEREIKPLSRDAQLICQSFLLAADAYLDYATNALNRATSRLHECLAINWQLEQDYDYPLFHLSRLEMVRNLMRVERKRGELDRAFELALALFDYLEGQIKTLPLLEGWDSVRLKDLPQEGSIMLFGGIAVDLAPTLLDVEFQARLKHERFIQGLHLTRTDCYMQPQTHQWFKIKAARHYEEWSALLDEATTFLEDGPAMMPPLWYSTLIDVGQFCDQLDSEAARHFKLEVSRASFYWKQLPRPWNFLLTQAFAT